MRRRGCGEAPRSVAVPSRWTSARGADALDVRATGGYCGGGVNVAQSSASRGSALSAEDELRADLAAVQRIAARDSSALTELYDRHCALLYGLILSIVVSQPVAEQVLEDVFTGVWTGADAYDAALGSPRVWLVGVARNRAFDRSRAGREEAPSRLSPPRSVTTTDQHAVIAALESLPADQRDLIEYAFFRGLSHAELAAYFQLPVETVKVRMRSGLQMLRAKYGDANQSTGGES